MKTTRIALGATVLALGIAGAGTGSAAPAVYKVTGGGQITTADMRGAGSTIAFTAQSQGEEGSAAKGQFQLQLRDAAGKETVHGTISCVVVFQPAGDMPGMAVLGGQSRTGEDFRIDVSDDGQGSGSMDMLLVQRGDAARDGADDDENDTSLCDVEDEAASMSLGRGNVKIHKAKA